MRKQFVYCQAHMAVHEYPTWCMVGWAQSKDDINGFIRLWSFTVQGAMREVRVRGFKLYQDIEHIY